MIVVLEFYLKTKNFFRVLTAIGIKQATFKHCFAKIAKLFAPIKRFKKASIYITLK